MISLGVPSGVDILCSDPTEALKDLDAGIVDMTVKWA